VRTRLATLTLATLLTLPAWAAPALADQGPALGSAPSLSAGSGSGSAGSGSEASGSGSTGRGSGPAGSGSGSGRSGSGPGSGGSGSGPGKSGSGSGGPGPDDRRSASGTSPQHSDSPRHSDSRPGSDTRARASAAEPAPPVGSVADLREGFPRLSTPPGLAAVAGVAGGVLLLVAMVAAGFRARARLGRLG
jgi:hypothetical protein